MTERMCDGFVLVDKTKDESLTNKPTKSKMSKPKASAAVGGTSSAGYQIPLDLKSLSKSIKDTSPLVSWYPDDGNTEIQIAKVAHIKDAKFDVLIIPVDTKMQSVNVLDGDLVRRNYGSWFPNVKPPVNPGQVFYSYQYLKNFKWQYIFAGVCVPAGQYDRHVATIVSNVLTDTKIKNDGIFGIPLNFTGFYDPLVFVEKLLEQKFRLSLKSLTVVLYCKGDEPSLPPFIKRVDEFMCKQRSPRRHLHSKMIQDELRIETKLIERGILNAGCECIVAAIGFDCQLNRGPILQSISKDAGSELQECINKLDKRKIPVDAIIHCPPFKLAWKGIKSILFGRLPKHESYKNEKIKQILSDFVRECLLMADDLQCSSIVFPALGSGHLKYPNDVIGASINAGIDKYAVSGIKGFVKKVCISYYGTRDDELYKKLNSGIIRRESRFESQQKHVADDIPGTDDKETTQKVALYQKGDQGTPNLQGWQKGADGTDDSSNKVQSSSNNNTIHTDDGEEVDSMSNSSDNKTSETSDDTELLLDDVTAEVNPGLTDYLLDSGTYEKFRDHFTQKFGIRVNIDKHAILFEGPLDKIVEAEELLDKIVEKGSNFNDVLKPENNPTSSGLLHGSDYLSSRNGEASYNVTTDYIPFDDSLVTPKGATVTVNNFHLQNKTNMHVFNTDDLFSFSTDVKVLTTDKDQTHKTENQFMLQAKGKIPKLNGIVVEKPFQILLPGKLYTCRFIVIAVVPNDSKDITKRDKDKNKFKSSVSELTNGILQKADELYGVRSITFPLLVNTEKGAHISTCCSVMSGEIVAFLERSTNIKHVNVILESGSILREFSKCVEQKLPKTGTLSTQF